VRDAHGRGRKPKIDADVRRTLRGDFRSVRQIAYALNVSASDRQPMAAKVVS
jgi:hypothetical protein